ncbi:MAG: arginine--tRNA ligase [Bacteroidetes bacterium]|nr:arginine--tRNA ligase [Bacteroidota bacterium]
MNIEQLLKSATAGVFTDLFGGEVAESAITINQTKKEFEGDYTIVTFPLIKLSKKSPEETGNLIGEALRGKLDIVAKFNVVKGFLNISFTDRFWSERLAELNAENFTAFPANGKKVLLEYCSPNTNKPLHIGHVRNMLLGYSMTQVMKANGYDVTTVSIYNDRGISICQSMAAYIAYGNGVTPESSGIKGDHLIGDYYVLFGKKVEEELRAKYNVPADQNVYKAIGKEKEVAQQETEIFAKAKDLLLKWEAGDAETIALWKKMNGWVYAGYQVTYDVMGVSFDKDYYESQTYTLGKDIIEEGLEKGVFYKRPDGAVAIDLTPDGLDEKILLRSDGTSLYMTQDLGTAQVRYDEWHMDKMIYVVANEQDYHFKVLKLCLEKLGKSWAEGIHHLSYALVESPTGRFKSREGKTADADDLIADVLQIAEQKTNELGKVDGFSEAEAKALYKTIGLGALKYFILRVNPYKKMIFNTEESIDFHGHTGPFIQYSHARIRSIIRRYAAEVNATDIHAAMHPTERELILQLFEYPNVLRSAADKFDPAEVANYAYNIAKLFNKFYNEVPILTAPTQQEKDLRILLSKVTGDTISKAMKLLGIEVPEKM